MSFEAPVWYAALDELMPVSAGPHVAFIRRSDADTSIHVDVQAALAAALARLRSIDDVKRRYMDADTTADAMTEIRDLDALYDSYMLAARSMEAAQARLDPEGRPDPTLGVFAASIALSRLAASFKSAHLLYRLGHATDGHAIMRVILEQIAWAHSAAGLDDEDELAALKPTKAFTELKGLYPRAWRIYRTLSSQTHLKFDEHRQRVQRREGQFHIVQVERAAMDGSSAILSICDIWLTVWEATQRDFLDGLDHILVDDDGVRPDPGRPFKRAMLDQLDAVETAVQAAAAGAGEGEGPAAE